MSVSSGRSRKSNLIWGLKRRQ